MGSTKAAFSLSAMVRLVTSNLLITYVYAAYRRVRNLELLVVAVIL